MIGRTANRSTNRDAARRMRPAPRKRLLTGICCIAVVTAGAIALALWWEERPLRAIEQSLARKEYAQALDLSNDYLKEFPSHVQAIDQKARALAGLERWSDADRLFERFGADSFASQRAWSQALLHEERWTEALPLLSQLDKQFPDDGEILHELCACEAKLGYFDEAVAAAGRLMQISGHVRRGRLLLGILHYKRGNNRLAIDAWKPLVDQGSDLSDLQTSAAEFLLSYGRAQIDDGRPAEAIEHLRRAVEIDPSPEVRNTLAEACDALGDRPAAVAQWQEVVAHSPLNRAAREGLARTALENRSPDEARRWLEPLLTQDELHSSTAFLAQRTETLMGNKAAAATWAARANSLRDSEKRIAALEQSLRDTPRSFWSRCIRAHRFASEGNPAQALVLAEELLKQNPEQTFVQQLADALRNRKPLPPLEMIPFKQF